MMVLALVPKSLPGQGFPTSARVLIRLVNKGLLGAHYDSTKSLKALNHALGEPTG